MSDFYHELREQGAPKIVAYAKALDQAIEGNNYDQHADELIDLAKKDPELGIVTALYVFKDKLLEKK